MIVTGYVCKDGDIVMHAPEFPYLKTRYVGYSMDEMKKKYRTEHGLKGKHIEWIMLDYRLERIK